MTDQERYWRSWGVSLLVHGALVAGAFLWFWQRPQQKPKPEPMRWEVNMIRQTRIETPPATVDRAPQKPEVALEPAMASLMPSMAPPPAAPPPNFGSPGKLALPGAGSLAGGVPVPTGGGFGDGWGLPTGATGASNFREALAAPGPEGLGNMLTPIVRIPPAYPLEARRKKIEGWVRLEFTVTETGAVEGVKVKSAEPAGVFEEAAIASIAQWKFRPAAEDGKPLRKRAAQTLRFELNR